MDVLTISAWVGGALLVVFVAAIAFMAVEHVIEAIEDRRFTRRARRDHRRGHGVVTRHDKKKG